MWKGKGVVMELEGEGSGGKRGKRAVIVRGDERSVTKCVEG